MKPTVKKITRHLDCPGNEGFYAAIMEHDEEDVLVVKFDGGQSVAFDIEKLSDGDIGYNNSLRAEYYREVMDEAIGELGHD